MSELKNKVASYAIIGFGNIGKALAKAFVRNGIKVSVATTRDPESFASAAAAIGPEIISTTLAEAIKADVIFLAVHFERSEEHTSELQSLMRISYAVFCLKKKKKR